MGAITGLLGVGGGAGGTSFGGPSMASQQGNNNMQQAYGMLQGVASGTGPNPAQDQYTANIQNLAKQQSGAIGSIQGISPALAARMASQQGSAAMQNAAAQGQANMATQQLGAMGAMGNIGGMQQGAANQMMGNMNSTNAGLAATTMQGQQGFIGGLFGGAGAFMNAPAAANGGEAGADFGAAPTAIPTNYYSASPMSVPVSGAAPQQQAKTQSLLSQFLAGGNAQPSMGGAAALQKGMTTFGAGLGNQLSSPGAPAAPDGGSDALPSAYGSDATLPSGNPLPNPAELGYAKGGAVKAMVSPGEVYIPPEKLKAAVRSRNPIKEGKKVPGKPKVPGNSYANDVVPAKLKEGGVVIPNSIMQSPNPAMAAHDMIAKIVAKQRARR